MKPRVLLVEDESSLVVSITDRLVDEGYSVDTVSDGDRALEVACTEPFDVILLDIMLPGKSGYDICRDLRRRSVPVPILMLTARAAVEDKVVGFKLGADDYLTKPFDLRELTVRIEALLRRAHVPSGEANGHFQFGNIRIDCRGTEVFRDGTPVELSAREFQLLRYLIEHRGQTLSRDRLLHDVWGFESDTYSRTVDVHVAGLRKKLEEDSRNPKLILTVQGLGYKFTG
jgi:two-component system alkaline phosphatase synthesis response regulator PhoP